jgi:hypothetical protein
MLILELEPDERIPLLNAIEARIVDLNEEARLTLRCDNRHVLEEEQVCLQRLAERIRPEAARMHCGQADEIAPVRCP